MILAIITECVYPSLSRSKNEGRVVMARVTSGKLL